MYFAFDFVENYDTIGEIANIPQKNSLIYADRFVVRHSTFTPRIRQRIVHFPHWRKFIAVVFVCDCARAKSIMTFFEGVDLE